MTVRGKEGVRIGRSAVDEFPLAVKSVDINRNNRLLLTNLNGYISDPAIGHCTPE